MYDKNAAYGGNENTEPKGLIRGAHGSKRVSGDAAGVEGSASAANPVSIGTSDIIIGLADGQYLSFDADPVGILHAEIYLARHKRKVKTAHFGETCVHFKNGKGVAQLRMSRREFFAGVRP